MHIYVIAASEHGPSKIGIARNPERRLKGLQTGSDRPLTLFHQEPLGFSAAAVEKAIHRQLAAKRTAGGTEWSI